MLRTTTSIFGKLAIDALYNEEIFIYLFIRSSNARTNPYGFVSCFVSTSSLLRHHGAQQQLPFTQLYRTLATVFCTSFFAVYSSFCKFAQGKLMLYKPVPYLIVVVHRAFSSPFPFPK